MFFKVVSDLHVSLVTDEDISMKTLDSTNNPGINWVEMRTANILIIAVKFDGRKKKTVLGPCGKTLTVLICALLM